MTKTKPITALYCRVSTKNQNHDRQRTILSDWVKSNRLRKGEYAWYSDTISGTTDAKSRHGLAKLMRDIDNGKVHSVIVERLDRLSRSTTRGLQLLSQLGESGIRVVSVKQNIDFNGSMGRLLSAIFLAIGQWQNETTAARIRESLATLKAQGKVLGRPRNERRYQQVATMRRSGLSAQQIGDRMKPKISRQSVYYLLKQAEESGRQSA